jgi:SAM-dependent methyltransferase
MTQESLSFDRAADYYDRTRALSPATMSAIVALLSEELRDRDRTLEVGVGTGRIALPLADTGIRLAGVDLSMPMMARLVHKAGGRPPFPLAVADATVLPFADAAFGAAFVVHVLHLIPRWRDAVREMARVCVPGGVLLMDLGGWHGASHEINERFFESVGLRPKRHRGLGEDEWDQLDELLAETGGRARPLPEIVDERRTTPNEVIDGLASGLFSQTWSVPEETLREAGVETREWALERYGSLTEPIVARTPIRWRAFDLP